MDVFKNGGLGYLAGFLILAAIIVAVVLTTGSSSSSGGSSPSPEPETDLEWVAVGSNSTNHGHIMYSSDGQSWTETSTGDSFFNFGRSVAYGTCNGIPLWVAVGDDQFNSPKISIMYSSDGQSWTKTSTGDSFSEVEA